MLGWALEIVFPIEFVVRGTPVSAQSSAGSKNAWMDRIKTASSMALPVPHFATAESVAVTLFYFSEEEMPRDLDNIVKPILDALNQHVYIDDGQVDRIVVQRFTNDRLYRFGNPTDALTDVIDGRKPALYVRIATEGLAEVSI